MKNGFCTPFEALELAYGVGVINSCAKEKILLEGLKYQSEDNSKVSYIGFLNIPDNWKAICDKYIENIFYHKYYFRDESENSIEIQVDKQDNKIYLLFDNDDDDDDDDDDDFSIKDLFSDVLYPLIKKEMDNNNLIYFCNINNSQFIIK